MPGPVINPQLLNSPPKDQVSKGRAPKELVFVSAPQSSTSTSRPSEPSTAHTTFQAQRQYAFIDGNDKKSRHTVQKHVQFDYQHKKRTLASLGGAPNKGKVVGWRMARIVPKGDSKSSDETSRRPSPLKHSKDRETQTSDNSQLDFDKLGRNLGVKWAPQPQSKSPTPDVSLEPTYKRGKNLPNRISLCPYCLGAGFVDKGSFGAERLLHCPDCKGTGFVGIKRTKDGFLEEDPEHPNVSPLSPLGAGQVDPFDSYPVALRESDRTLVVHYVSYLSYMLYQLPTAAKCNPHRMVFRFALADPVAFEGVMTIASHHMASVNRVVDPSLKLRHLTQVVGLVNRQIDKNSFTDETIYAVGALACIETWSQNLERETMHWAALMEIVKKRGGIQDVRRTSWMMEAVVYFVGVSFYCPDQTRSTSILSRLFWGGASTPYAPSYLYLFSHLQQPLSYTQNAPQASATIPMDVEDAYDRRHACEQFLSLLRTLVKQLQNSTTDKHPPSKLDSDITSLPHRFLRYFHPLSHLLKVAPKPDTPPIVTRMRSLEVYSSLACLLFINVALLDYSPSPSTSPDPSSPKDSIKPENPPLYAYLKWLSETISEMLSFNCKAQVLMWIFWYNGGDGADPTNKRNSERNWLVFRMLWVVKRLEAAEVGRRLQGKEGKGLVQKVWRILFEAVLGCIGRQTDGQKKGGNEIGEGLGWDEAFEDELRRKILGDIYAGRPLVIGKDRPGEEREDKTESAGTGTDNEKNK